MIFRKSLEKKGYMMLQSQSMKIKSKLLDLDCV